MGGICSDKSRGRGMFFNFFSDDFQKTKFVWPTFFVFADLQRLKSEQQGLRGGFFQIEISSKMCRMVEMSRTERSKTLNPIWHHKNYMSDTGAMSHSIQLVQAIDNQFRDTFPNLLCNQSNRNLHDNQSHCSMLVYITCQFHQKL